MRLISYISTFLILTFLFGFKTNTSPITIYGHLRNSTKDKDILKAKIIIFVKADNKILSQDTLNEKGEFVLEFLPEKIEKHFDFYCYGLGVDTILISSVTIFESDNPQMTFYLPEKHKKNKKGKIICPICKQSNRIYKINYGDEILDPLNKDKKLKFKNASPKIINGQYYARTCIVGFAKYYCEREKVEF